MRVLSASIACLILFSGCGSNAPNSGLGNATDQTTTATQVRGRAFLGSPASGSPVTMQTSQGVVLATTTTTANGEFRLAAAAPQDFVLKLTLPGSSLNFYSDVHQTGNLKIILADINLPTTMAHQLREGSQLSLADAEAMARRQLGIPPGFILNSLSAEDSLLPFSHLAFLAAADRNGGLASFAASAPTALKAKDAPPYRLNYDAVHTPFTRLEPSLLNIAETGRQRVLVLGAVPGGDALKSVGKFVGLGLANWIETAGINEAYGYVSSQTSWNVGTSAKLSEILASITQVETQIAQLQSQLQKAFLQATLDVLAANVNTITTATGLITALNMDYGGANPSITIQDQPVTLPLNQAVTALLNDVSTNENVSSSLSAIENGLLGLNGASNTYFLAQSNYMLAELGINGNPQFGYTPVRSSAIYNHMTQFLEFYQGNENTALNYLSEAAHVSPSYLPSQTGQFKVKIDAVTARSRAVARLQRLESAQIMPAGSGVVVDLENGLIWLSQIQSADTFANATSLATATNLTVTDSSGQTFQLNNWRLPYYQECKSLQARGYSCPTKDPNVAVNSNNPLPDFGQSAAGLSALGFVGAENLNTNGDIWYQSVGLNGGESFAYRYYNDTEFRLNRENDNHETLDSDETRPFVLVQHIQGLLDWGGEDTSKTYTQSNSDPYDNGLLPGPSWRLLGVPTSLQLQADGDQVSALVGYTSYLGGTIVYGTSGNKVGTVRVQNGTAFEQVLEDTQAATYFASSGPNLGTNDTVSVEVSADISNLIPTPVRTVVGPSVPQRSYGSVQWHTDVIANLSAQITGTVAGYRNGAFQAINATLPLLKASAAPRQLTQIVVMPQNQNNEGSSTKNAQFQAVGFYDDGSLKDLTQEVTWSISCDQPSSSQIGQGNSPNSDAGLLTVGTFTSNPVPQAATFNVTASYQNGSYTSLTHYKTVTQ